MQKISIDLIQQSDQSINALGERQLSLQNNRIPQIENLGVTQNQYDCIDLSDNEIKKLGNFCVLLRLKTLMLNNNRINKIQDPSNSLPNMENLSLINNKITELSEIDELKDCEKLQRLVLYGNPVASKDEYRLYTIARLPQLRILDFQKVSETERNAAKKKYQFQEDSKDFESQKKLKIRKLIENAKSIEEVNRIELLLKSGELGNQALFEKTLNSLL